MAHANENLFSVLPWNGYKAAVSLTFDDGDPIHLDLAIPEMQKRKIRGTFFLIAGNLTRQDEWGKIAGLNMEIGNHSMTHKHAYELNDDNIYEEVDKANEVLKKLSGQNIFSFAYPFVEITEPLRKRVEKNCIIARGGTTGVLYYTPDMTPDWYDIHSQATMTHYDFETYKEWIDTALDSGAWTVFMIHAIDGSDWWQPIPKNIFIGVLEYLKENQDKIWIAPFGEVSAYWKAQKIIESAKIIKKEGKYIIKWKKPELFPPGVLLKIKVNDKVSKIIHAEKIIQPDSQSVFTISFDLSEMTFIKN
jgi:hypothetical protein